MVTHCAAFRKKAESDILVCMDATLVSVIQLVVWAIFLAAAFLTIIFGGVLAYHWYRFAMNPFAATVQLVVYSVVSLILLGGLLSATLAINGI